MAEVVIFSDVYQKGYVRAAGAYRIATVLRDQGVSVQVIDFACRLSYDQFRSAIKKHITKNTKMIGISNSFLAKKGDKRVFPNDYALRLIGKAKERYNIPVVIGGNRNGYQSIIENDPNNVIDYIVTGFADKAIVDIYNKLSQGQILPSRVIDSHSQPYMFHDFDTNARIQWQPQDHIFENEILPIETARGCIFRCSYCFFPLNGKNGKNSYMKNKDVLVSELTSNYENYGVTRYDIMDDLLNDSVEKVNFIHDVFTSVPFDVQWTAYARADLIIAHPHTLDLMANSGCKALRFGIETLNKESGKTIGKSMSADKMISGLQWMRNNSDISLGGSFIAGLPFETKETLQHMIDWLLDESNPLHHRQIGNLEIPRPEDRSDYSKMMVNPMMYGYKDLEPDNKDQMIWDNGYFDLYYALEKLEPVWKKLPYISSWNSHDAFRVINVGYDMDEVLFNPIADVKGIDEKTLVIRDKYFEKLMQ